MTTCRPATRTLNCRSMRRGRSDCRQAVIALSLVWLLVIVVLLGAWVINWNYFVLVNRNMQQKTDVIALAAATELLDEDRLRDYPGPLPLGPDQTNDFADAVTVANQFREANNKVGSSAFCIDADDIFIESGYVVDVTGKSTPYAFEDARALPDPVPPPPSPDPQHNTLHICAQRPADGNHPVRYILDGFSADSPRAVDVRGGAYATLDDLLVGFQPTTKANAPVVPIAIQLDAWNTERANGPDDYPTTPTPGNQIRELKLRLAKTGIDPTDANAALVFFNGVIDVTDLASRILVGLSQGDLPPAGQLGPVTTTSPWPLPAIQWVNPDGYPGLNSDLAAALNATADSANPKRVFPLYATFTDTFPTEDGEGTTQLIGFVAATIYHAQVNATDNRLTVDIEPRSIVHHTAWTVAPNHWSTPNRNSYIYKVRISH